MSKSTINPREISQFNSISNQWWDYKGKFKPLHEMVPHRIEYIISSLRGETTKQSHDDKIAASPAMTGLTVLDVGCGGGLSAEPLTRLGAKVTGIDAEANTIEIAKAHAKDMELDIDYQVASIEGHAKLGKSYDVVLALEIIEHVDHVPLFCEQLKTVLKPGGTLILSTLNRTLTSYAKAIVAAEYMLRWVPRGTHDWQKFVKPSEMVNQFEELGLTLHSLKGLSYNPLARIWTLTDDLSVNYFACFKR